MDGKIQVKSSYDLKLYHVFIDDIQTALTTAKRVDHLKDFVDKHYNVSCQTGKYFWLCNDVVQVRYQINLEYSPPPLFAIPKINLTRILRNTSKIIPVVMEAREKEIMVFGPFHQMLPEVIPGHHIHGAPIIFHLKEKQPSDIDGTLMRFALQMVKQEMRILLERSSSFRPSDIAIIFDNLLTLQHDQDVIGYMLKQEYNLETATIRDHVMNENTQKVVIGTSKDCMSYEAPCVIYIDTGHTEGIQNIYTLASRARTRLTFISTNTYSSLSNYFPKSVQLATLVRWVERGGHFVKK